MKTTKLEEAIMTCGDLRTFLINLMMEVKNETIDADKASRIAKVAAQVNENLYAEIKTARLMLDVGEKSFVIGNLPIGKTINAEAA